MIWMNIARSGITLRDKDAKLFVSHVSDQSLADG